MRKNILLVFICSFFILPIFAKADSLSDILPKNNFDIIEFDKNTNKPKLVDPSESTKKILDNVKKAREEKEALEKKESEQSKLSYKNYKSRMSDLTSKVSFDNKFFGFDSNVNYFFNSLVQAVFWLGKIIFYVIAEVYTSVEGMSDVSGLLNETVKNSSKVFSSLFNTEIIYLVGASMAVYLLYLFATGKGSFFKTLIKMLLIYPCIAVYFIQLSVTGQHQYLITHVYDAFRTTTITLNGEITKTLTGESKNGVETYFSETLLKGYKYMNSPVNDKGEFVLSEKEFEDLAGYKQGDGDHLVGDKKIKDIAKDKDPENKMLKNEWGLKFMYASASDVDIIVMGTIYLLLGLSRFFFLIVFILLIVLLPFILLLSLFPKMEHLLIGFNKKAISMLILSSVTLLATTLFVFFYNSLTDFISLAVGQNVLIVIFVKAILLFLMFKNKNMILSLFSQIGRLPVNRMNGLNLNQGTKKIRERMFGAGKSGLSAGGQFAKGGLKMGKDNLQSRLKGLRSNGTHSKNETLGKFGNRYASMKHGVRGTVNSFKEKGNRAMASLYKVRASAFKDQESDKYKALNKKKKAFTEKAKAQGKVKNSSFAEVKRLKEQRLARKKAEFKAKKEQRMNQVDSGKNPKIDTPKTKRMKGGNSSPKKQGRKYKKNRPNVTIDRKRNKI